MRRPTGSSASRSWSYLRELPRFHALLLYPGLRPVETEQRFWEEERHYADLIRRARGAMVVSLGREH